MARISTFSEQFLNPRPFASGRISERRVQSLGQRLGASDRRSLDIGLGRAITSAGHARNPALRRLRIREALAGFGEGLSKVSGAATRGALNIASQEFRAATESSRQATGERFFRERLAERETAGEEEAAATHTTRFRGTPLTPFGGFAKSGPRAPQRPFSRSEFDKNVKAGIPGFADLAKAQRRVRSFSAGSDADTDKRIDEIISGR